MKVYKLPELCEVPRLPEGACVALGNFDGVHKGHRALFDACTGVKAVWTFSSLAKPGEEIPFITDTKTRLRYFAECGLDYAVLEDFERVREMTPEDFVSEYLVKKLKIRRAVCGFNFRFGYRGAGDADTLVSLLSARGVSCTVKSPVFSRGRLVSSSSVREAILGGDMELAEELLGHPFAIEFPVIHGERLGRTIGVPTINQDFPKGHIIPRGGIYACAVTVGDDVFLGVANVGTRPTVSTSGKVNCETHIIDYSGILYGKEIRVEFYRRLRDEKRFDSVEGLKEQIGRDVSDTLDFFQKRFAD